MDTFDNQRSLPLGPSVNRRYGWRPSRPDHRDLKHRSGRHALSLPLPGKVDLRPLCPKVYDQGPIGSCTANAWAGLFEFLLMKGGHKAFTPSRLFIYYNEREAEGTVEYDSGAALRDGAKVLSTLGGPDESLWWYDPPKFPVRPNRHIYAEAARHKVLQYSSLGGTRADDLEACLAAGYPFVFGFTVFEGFESDAVAASGVVKMPGKTETPLGGHAVMAVGYDRSQSVFVVRNSWGNSWGLSGYFLMPYEYLTNPDLAGDFWTAKAVVA